MYIEENKKLYVMRILACLLCFPTIGVMFLDWIQISLLNDIKDKIGFFNFLDSDYTLLETLNFLNRLGDSVSPSIKRIVVLTGITEVISIISIVVLFVMLLFGSTKSVKNLSVISFVLCTVFFGVFLFSLNFINTKVANASGNETIKVVQALPYPYIMLACSTLIMVISIFLLERSKE